MPTRFRLPPNTKRVGNKCHPTPITPRQPAALPEIPIRVGWTFMPTRFRLTHNTKRVGNKCPPYLHYNPTKPPHCPETTIRVGWAFMPTRPLVLRQPEQQKAPRQNGRPCFQAAYFIIAPIICISRIFTIVIDGKIIA